MRPNRVPERQEHDNPTIVETSLGPAALAAGTRPAWRDAWWSPSNIAAAYLWVILVVAFSLWSPQNFLTVQTFLDILNQNAVVGLAALILVVPLACGALDLSIGSMMGLGGILVAMVLGVGGIPAPIAILVAIGGCAIAGLVNALVVIRLRVNALIATLATSLILYAAQIGLSKNSILTKNLQGGFLDLAQADIAGVTLPVFYLVALTLILVYLLEWSPIGRWIYAAGYDPAAARLVGIRVDAVKSIALVATGAVAGFAGVVATARVQAATPSNGMDLLFPAITAVFLGATQFRRGRFNPWGTLLAVLVLGTGEAGLVIAGAPAWFTDIFTGVLLIAAVGAAAAERKGGNIHVGGV